MTHGLIFHYFWDEKIPSTQGSISADIFSDIIDDYAESHNLLCAQEYMKKAVCGALAEDDVCITFDDGLYSQYAVAEPVLRKKGLTAFYFVYTSPMEGIYEKIEIFRAFRNRYDAIDDFYDDFFRTVIEFGYDRGIDYKQVIDSKEADDYDRKYDYYSKNDRIFRYLRDVSLRDEYVGIMEFMMKKNQFDPQRECENIWIRTEEIAELHSRGNMIGLHSHTHPTILNKLSYRQKTHEYSHNKEIIESILGGGVKINSASYPCDAYDKDSDEILSRIGIDIAFIAHMENQTIFQPRRIPRLDASYVMKR